MDGAVREAIVDPEITRREVISRVASGEYKNISFIHEIADLAVNDITAEIMVETALPEMPLTDADLQANRFDHYPWPAQARGRVMDVQRGPVRRSHRESLTPSLIILPAESHSRDAADFGRLAF
jgi:hypothetical protein